MACVSPGWRRGRRLLYTMSLRQRLLTIPIPLREREPAVPLDLQALIDEVYVQGRYCQLDYGIDPVPPLPAGEAKWAQELLQTSGRR